MVGLNTFQKMTCLRHLPAVLLLGLGSALFSSSASACENWNPITLTCTSTAPLPPSPVPIIGPGIGDHPCGGELCLGGPGASPGAGWTPTYNAYYQDAHSCNMSEEDRQRMATDAVRADVLQEQQENGRVEDRRLEIRGYGGSSELFEIIAGDYRALGNAALIYGYNFVRLVPGSCRSGSAGG